MTVKLDSQGLQKLKMHLQGAMDCLAKYEMDEGEEVSEDEPSAADSTSDVDADAGLKSLKMKLLAAKG